MPKSMVGEQITFSHTKKITLIKNEEIKQHIIGWLSSQLVQTWQWSSDNMEKS